MRVLVVFLIINILTYKIQEVPLSKTSNHFTITGTLQIQIIILYSRPNVLLHYLIFDEKGD